MEENPTPRNKVEEQILGALGKLDQRLSSLETRQTQPETRQTQPEKYYIGAASESWQNLPSDRGGEE